MGHIQFCIQKRVNIMEPHIEKLKIEREDLDQKIEKLESFISNNQKFNELDYIDKELMSNQLEYMMHYSDVLSERISRENNKIVKPDLTI